MPRRRIDKETNSRIAGRLGRVIRTARSDAALTQEALAERLEITPEAYGRIERGLSVPSYPTLLKLCAVLDLTANDLLHEEGGVRPVVAREPGRTVELNEIVRHAAQLSPRAQRAILWVVRELAGREEER